MEKKIHISFYTVNGRHCLGYMYNGVLYVLNWIGKAGDCVDTSGRSTAWR